MQRTLTSRQSSLVVLVTMVALAVTVIALNSVSDAAQSLVTWCRNFVVAKSASGGVFAVAVTSIVSVLAIGAAANVLSFVFREAWTAVRFARSVAGRKVNPSSSVLAARDEAGIGAEVVVVQDPAPFAAAVGILSPRIVLSTAMIAKLTRAELRAVLAHENGHCAERHPLQAIMWETLRRAFFFLPTLGDVATHFAVRREIAADTHALRACGSRPLASALLKTVSTRATFLPQMAAAFGHLQARISALAGKRGTDIRLSAGRTFATAAMATLIVAAHFAVGSSVAQAGSDPHGSSCPSETVANMSEINFSPYFSIRVPQMSPVPVDSTSKNRTVAPVQSTAVQP